MKQGESIMNYRIIDKETYYRKGVYRHFTEDCRCSTSMTARIDVTALVAYSRQAGTKFYLNFLYILSNMEIKKGLFHGEFSLNHPEQYAEELSDMMA